MRVEENIWQEMRQIIANANVGIKIYSTTNINMDCPRTMTIWNYCPGDRGIQEYPQKINHMARDKK